MGQGARPPVSRKLPFLKSYRDRHGKARHYLRMPGVQSVALPGDYGSREFIEAYWEAREAGQPREKAGKPAHPRSFAALVPLYYKSRAYTALKPITRATYRNVIERFREAHGNKLVTGVRQRHVVAILDGLSGNRETWRKCIRLLLNLALERGWIDVHPMAGLRRPRKALKGFQAWGAADVAAYEAKWPTGSRERLALALLLYTGQRRADVVNMGRQHVRDGKINVVQQKTGIG
jgi:integrase